MAIVPGIFSSKLHYALLVYSACWQTHGFQAIELNRLATTKADVLSLKKLQNKIMNIVLNVKDPLTPPANCYLTVGS